MADLKRVESFQYPSGHFAHLTDNQQEQLDAFKQLCKDEGCYRPPGTDGNPDPSHDDETLLRFLRARRFVPQEALKQFKDTEDWRKEHGVDTLYYDIEVDEYEATRRLYPQWLGRRDKRGIPVYLFEVAPLNSKNIGAYEKELSKALTTSPKVPTKNLRLFALYESLTRFVQPLCSAIHRKHPETPISQSNNIVDISGVGLKQFWNLKNHMQDASQLATAHYPETLDRIFIIGAPAFFPTVWGWIKRWFDPVTVSKIFILSPANVFPTLSQYIDPDNIPKKYGGNLDFEFGMMPVLEPEIEAAIEWESPATQNGKNTFPIGPIRWEEGEDGSMTAVAVGQEKGVPRLRTVFTIPNPVKPAKQVVPNTPIDEDELALTTVGTATQPPDADDTNNGDSTPPTDTPNPATTPKPESQAATPTPATSTTDSKADETKETSLPIREGTSDTRYERQHQTHAAGQLADASATAAVTSTVSLAAGAVAELADGAKTEEKIEEKAPEKSPERKVLDEKMDVKSNPAVEGFLRGQNTSKVEA